MAKSAWLQEVEDDAVRIQTKRFRDQEEERQYRLSKQEGVVKAKVEAEASEAPAEKAVDPGKEGK